MYKKLHKRLEKLLGQEVLDEEGALLASGLILAEAFDKASKSGDVAVMIDISDRWMLLSKMLSGEVTEDDDSAVSFKGPLGFLASLEIEEEVNDDTPEGPNEGPSGIKIRKEFG
jgi:hypothetical protein